MRISSYTILLGLGLAAVIAVVVVLATSGSPEGEPTLVQMEEALAPECEGARVVITPVPGEEDLYESWNNLSCAGGNRSQLARFVVKGAAGASALENNVYLANQPFLRNGEVYVVDLRRGTGALLGRVKDVCGCGLLLEPPPVGD